MTASVTYVVNEPVSADAVAALFADSGIRRPHADLPRIARMLAGASLIVTAWDGEVLVGIARALSDFCYCTYVSDLAVARAHQRHGIGRTLLAQVQAAAGDQSMILLLSAPEAMTWYARLGLQAVTNGWLIPRQG